MKSEHYRDRRDAAARFGSLCLEREGLHAEWAEHGLSLVPCRCGGAWVGDSGDFLRAVNGEHPRCPVLDEMQSIAWGGCGLHGGVT